MCYPTTMQKYAVIHKEVGETPLSALERYRTTVPMLSGIPMAYAGRLDPMAEGKLLILIGDECKVQEKYHSLDKAYTFEVLFGVSSDTADVLGRLSFCGEADVTEDELVKASEKYIGTITLPYPHFSARPVGGKPLHVWKLEGKIQEIEIPTKTSHVYRLALKNIRTVTKSEVYDYATSKIETIPEVTDERKKLGADFRRVDVREDWRKFKEHYSQDARFSIATFDCVCSSGTYMRTLAEKIAKDLGTCGLAYSIKRTDMGTYVPLPFGLGFWRTQY
jgi:tRNA pseudouridine(55) synthase